MSARRVVHIYKVYYIYVYIAAYSVFARIHVCGLAMFLLQRAAKPRRKRVIV